MPQQALSIVKHEPLTIAKVEPITPQTSKELVIAKARGSSTLSDLGTGVKKGIKRTLGNLASGAATMFPGINYTPTDQARIDQQTKPEGTAEKIGFAAETVAEMAVPGGPITKAATRLIPSAKRAGVAFQQVMSKAKDIPVEVSGPTNVAMRIKQLADRGASMPKVVRDFLKRVNEPGGGAMTYAEARDFATNISRLSSTEYKRVTPVVQKEIHALRMSLNSAVKRAADKVGMGDEHAAAMKEYSKAAKLGQHVDRGRKALVKAVVPSAYVAGGYYLSRLLGGR